MTIPTALLCLFSALSIVLAYTLGRNDGLRRGRVLQAALMRDARDTNSKAARHLAQLRDARSSAQ